ncbi:unnamed protein product, partial [Notodromas monacha]
MVNQEELTTCPRRLRTIEQLARLPYAANIIGAVEGTDSYLKEAKIPIFSSALGAYEAVIKWIACLPIISTMINVSDWMVAFYLETVFFIVIKIGSIFIQSKRKLGELTEPESLGRLVPPVIKDSR